MLLVSSVQHLLPGFEYGFCSPIVDHFRSEQTDPRVPVLLVVPGEEGLTESSTIAPKHSGNSGRYFSVLN
jgi:hypothetical protein